MTRILKTTLLIPRRSHLPNAPRDHRQMGLFHAGSHEEDQVLVSCFPQHRDLEFERLQLCLVVQVGFHIQHLDRDVSMPVTSVKSDRQSYFIRPMNIHIHMIYI